MAIWNSDIGRIVLAAFFGMVTGSLYYNPAWNPAAKIWLRLAYPNIDDPRIITDPTLPMIGTAFLKLVAAAILNRYVNRRRVPTFQLIQMSVELWLLLITFTLPHALFATENLKIFAINSVHDLLIALVISFTVGYNRFPTIVGRRVGNYYEIVED